MQIHTLRACSLLVIPPPKERVPPPGGFPTDLSDLNLSSWAGLIQDVTSGLLVPLPNLGSNMSLPAMTLLELLEKTIGWGYCRFCYHLGSRCICMGAYSPAPPTMWSQVVEESPGYRVTASSGGMTAPSTTAAEMSRYVPPPPHLPPIDFSKWRLLHPEAPASRGLTTAPPSLPGVGRSIRLRGMAKRIAGTQMAQRSGAWPNRCQHHLRRHCVHPKWCCLSANHAQSGWPCHISKWYNCQRVTSNPPQVKLPLWAVQAHRTVEDLPREGGEMAGDPSVTQEVYRGRQVHSHHVRRVICCKVLSYAKYQLCKLLKTGFLL